MISCFNPTFSLAWVCIILRQTKYCAPVGVFLIRLSDSFLTPSTLTIGNINTYLLHCNLSATHNKWTSYETALSCQSLLRSTITMSWPRDILQLFSLLLTHAHASFVSSLHGGLSTYYCTASLVDRALLCTAHHCRVCALVSPGTSLCCLHRTESILCLWWQAYRERCSDRPDARHIRGPAVWK